MKNTKRKLYVVHCVDTEGPLYEEKSVPFDMIKNIFGLELEQSEENLRKLRNCELDLNGLEQEVSKVVDIHRITTRGSWKEIDKMLNAVTSTEFRNDLLDSNGNGWIFNWFCMAHEGFTGANQRRRVKGYHAVFDHYRELIKKQNSKDFIGFHYHPLPISGNYNDSGTAYWGEANLNEILCHAVIDRGWFPAAFRPGFHTERPDANWFLEQWIPFDYANQAMKDNEEGQRDLANGRFGDWRFAPLEWRPYHPDHDDYQKKGSCRRWITRCLNMYARTRQISQEDVEEAFSDALKYGKAILAFTDHDYKDMEYEITRVRNIIKNVSEKYSDVEFIYSNAVDAIRNCMDIKYEQFTMNAEIINDGTKKYLDIKVDNDIFGPQPFLAIKTKDNRYIWENLDFTIPGREWTYTFDNNTILLDAIEAIGVAANNKYGFTKIIVIGNDGHKKDLCYN